MRIRGFIHTQHSVTTLGLRPRVVSRRWGWNHPQLKENQGQCYRAPRFNRCLTVSAVSTSPVTLSVTSNVKYITLMASNMCISLTVISQSEARISTEHGIMCYIGIESLSYSARLPVSVQNYCISGVLFHLMTSLVWCIRLPRHRNIWYIIINELHVCPKINQ